VTDILSRLEQWVRENRSVLIVETARVSSKGDSGVRLGHAPTIAAAFEEALTGDADAVARRLLR